MCVLLIFSKCKPCRGLWVVGLELFILHFKEYKQPLHAVSDCVERVIWGEAFSYFASFSISSSIRWIFSRITCASCFSFSTFWRITSTRLAPFLFDALRKPRLFS